MVHALPSAANWHMLNNRLLNSGGTGLMPLPGSQRHPGSTIADCMLVTTLKGFMSGKIGHGAWGSWDHWLFPPSRWHVILFFAAIPVVRVASQPATHFGSRIPSYAKKNYNQNSNFGALHACH
jgi:hypothetical protein